MILMTNEIREKLIKAYEENKDEETPLKDRDIIVKYFYPMGRYTFYAIEGEAYEEDMIMFGYVLSPLSPDFDELGYVSLNELKSLPLMERDLYFKETKLGEVMKE